MARTLAQTRWWTSKTKDEKRSALGQAYGMGELGRAKIEGRYPPRDQLAQPAEETK